GADVGARVDRVGNEESAYYAEENPPRIVLLQHAGQATPGHHPDLRAEELHRRHHRKSDYGDPQSSISESGTGGRVGAYARRIVVRGAGDESGPEKGEKLSEWAPGLVDPNLASIASGGRARVAPLQARLSTHQSHSSCAPGRPSRRASAFDQRSI